MVELRACAHSRPGGLRLARARLRFRGPARGASTKRTLRILPKPEGRAAGCLMGFSPSNEVAGGLACPTFSQGRRSCHCLVRPGGKFFRSFHGPPLHPRGGGFRLGGLPRLRGISSSWRWRAREGGDRSSSLASSSQIAARQRPRRISRKPVARGKCRDLASVGSPPSARMGESNDYMCLDGTIPVSEFPTWCWGRHPAKCRPSNGLDVAKRSFHAGRRATANIRSSSTTPTSRAQLETSRPRRQRSLKLMRRGPAGCLTGEHGVGDREARPDE